MEKTVKVSEATHKRLREINVVTERPFNWILKRAVLNYWKAVIGNRLNTKK